MLRIQTTSLAFLMSEFRLQTNWLIIPWCVGVVLLLSIKPREIPIFSQIKTSDVRKSTCLKKVPPTLWSRKESSGTKWDKGKQPRSWNPQMCPPVLRFVSKWTAAENSMKALDLFQTKDFAWGPSGLDNRVLEGPNSTKGWHPLTISFTRQNFCFVLIENNPAHSIYCAKLSKPFCGCVWFQSYPKTEQIDQLSACVFWLCHLLTSLSLCFFKKRQGIYPQTKH